MSEVEEELKEFEAKGAIIKIMGNIAEQNLFRKLSQQVNEDYNAIEKILKDLGEDEIQKQPLEVASLVHYLMKHYTGTALAQIFHPLYGKQLIVDRTIQIAELLTLITERRINNLLKKIENNNVNPNEDLAQEIQTILRIHQISMMALREALNRFISLLFINAPAPLRPPLANVKMGFDLM